MLTQEHATAIDQPAEQQSQTKPPYGIEMENIGITNQSTNDGSHTCRVDADFPPKVDDGASTLYQQADNNDAAHKRRGMNVVEKIEEQAVAYDMQNVRDKTIVAQLQVLRGVFMNLPIDVYAHCRKEKGHDIDQSQQKQLQLPGKQGKIGEQE